MDLRLLKYFLVVAEEGNITKAAHRLHMSQPPLSKQLKQLEDECGVLLFIRGKKNIQLTDAGLFLQSRAEEILSFFNQTQNQIMEYRNGGKGHITIGSVEAFARNNLPGLLLEFQKQAPNITFDVFSSGNVEEILHKVDRGNIDLAFVREPFDPNAYNHFVMTQDCWGVLMPPDHPLVAQPAISPEMLEKEALLAPNQEPLFKILEDWFRAANVEPNFYCRWNSSAVGEALIGKGLGLGVGVGLRYENHGNLVFRKFSPEISSDISVLWSESHFLTDSIQCFLTYLQQVGRYNQPR